MQVRERFFVCWLMYHLHIFARMLEYIFFCQSSHISWCDMFFLSLAGECKLYEVLVRDFVFVYWCPARPTNKQLAQRLHPHFFPERSRFNLRSSLDYSPFFRPFQSFRPFPQRASIEYQEKKTTEVKWNLLRKWKMHRKQQQQRTVDDENISKTFCAWKVKEKLQRFFLLKISLHVNTILKHHPFDLCKYFFYKNHFSSPLHLSAERCNNPSIPHHCRADATSTFTILCCAILSIAHEKQHLYTNFWNEKDL